MATVLFITEAALKSLLPMYDNVDSKDIVSHIVRAQDIDLQQVLGSKLYNELKSSAEAGTLSADQEELIGYGKPYIAHMAYYYAMPFIWAKTTNKSVSKMNSEHSTTVGMNELEYLRNQVKNQAEYYGQRLVDFLKLEASVTKFPSYYMHDTPIAPKRGSAYSSGMYLGNGYRRTDCDG